MPITAAGYPSLVARLKTLIVDEHPSVRRALADRLATADFIGKITTYPSLPLAQARIEEIQPDVVLLGMPAQVDPGILNQIEALAERLAGWGGALLILATYAVDEDRCAVLRAGARCYLLKDIDTKRLLVEIESCSHESSIYAKNPRKGNQIPDGDLPGEI